MQIYNIIYFIEIEIRKIIVYFYYNLHVYNKLNSHVLYYFFQTISYWILKTEARDHINICVNTLFGVIDDFKILNRSRKKVSQSDQNIQTI